MKKGIWDLQIEVKSKGIKQFLLYLFTWFTSLSVFAFSFTDSINDRFLNQPEIGSNKVTFNPYFGVNYWYGGFECVDSVKGLRRVQKELDFLNKNGVTTLRVMISAEGGNNQYKYQINPSIQPFPGKYNEQILRGFDRFLAEVQKRNMKVIFVLSNNWEWSGGFGQYVEWSHPQKPPLPKTPQWDWDKYCEFVGSFYSDTLAMNWYWDYVRFVLKRTSTVDGKKYAEHAAIFAWQLANEPRPMRPEQGENYVEWIRKSAKLIRNLDTNHLISIGVEGRIGIMNNMDFFERIHRIPNIDYATIHIWPKTWNWYQGPSSEVFGSDCIEQISNYISEHAATCRKIGIPLVIEEFGLERDADYSYNPETKEFQLSRFSPKSKTVWRDGFYALVYSLGLENGVVGFNFWGYAGLKENVNSEFFMKSGMHYSADPPQEEQGLYSVFKSDKSTWKVIRRFSKKMKSDFKK